MTPENVRNNEILASVPKTESRSNLRRSILIGVAIGCAASVATTAFNIYEDDVRVILESPTDAEKMISDAVENSGLSETIWVDCTTAMPDGTEMPDNRMGYVSMYPLIPEIPIIHINQKQCNLAVEYAGLDDKRTATSDQIKALNTVVHESAHLDYNSGDEAFISCVALQKLPVLAEAMGATAAEALISQKINITNYHDFPSEYISSECRDNGLYDIEPETAGVFPLPPVS